MPLGSKIRQYPGCCILWLGWRLAGFLPPQLLELDALKRLTLRCILAQSILTKTEQHSSALASSVSSPVCSNEQYNSYNGRRLLLDPRPANYSGSWDSQTGDSLIGTNKVHFTAELRNASNGFLLTFPTVLQLITAARIRMFRMRNVSSIQLFCCFFQNN